MKKVVFAMLLLCMASVSVFAKSNGWEPKIKVNERDAPDCKKRGGVCMVVINFGGGVERTYYTCCMDVNVIRVPGGSN